MKDKKHRDPLEPIAKVILLAVGIFIILEMLLIYKIID